MLSPDGGRPDPILTMLTIDEAAWLTALVRAAFAEHGRETTPDGSGGLRGDGQTYGLHNLAAHVVAVPRRAWPELARRHRRDLGAADPTPPPTTPGDRPPTAPPKRRERKRGALGRAGRSPGAP